MLLVRLILVLWLLTPMLLAQSVADYAAAAREVRLDPQQCFRVRDLFLEREDVKFYFTDGLLIFAKPLLGHDVGAFFVAQETTDSAEILALPPSTQERHSLASFTGDGLLNRHFNHAALLFSDDTADVLRAALTERANTEPDVEQGESLSRRWSPVFRNLMEHASLRLATDLLSDRPKTDGFFAGAIGGTGARFDIIIEPRGEIDQISIGQSVRKENAIYQEVWSRFPARSFRQGDREPVRFGGSVVDYDLNVVLDEDLAVEVQAKATLAVNESGRRTFPFSLSRRLRVTQILVNGAPAEYMQEASGISLPDDSDYGTVLLVLPQPTQAGENLEIEFQYNGRVVDHADNDVYLVGSRTSWYPRGRFEPSRYRLTFHYPAALDLRATGALIETTQSGSRKTSVFVAEQPIQLAGFNLGSYIAEVRDVEGYQVEVLANREVEARFRPTKNFTIAPPTTDSRGRRSPISTGSTVLIPIPAEPISQPADQIKSVADEVAGSFRYFLKEFGPPISRSISVTPIPDGYGQGFPGLVYAPTLSYLDLNKPPLANLSQPQQAFYKEVLFPHEISHQWWGNLISGADSSDSWLIEALATYSALRYLEQSKGPEALQRILGYYKTDLRRRNTEDKPVESAGPLVLGDRLTSSLFPNALAIIVYGKGAWFLHMLRASMGDESFAQLLKNLPIEFARKPLNTEAFRLAAAAYLPAGSADPELKEFFDQWAYGTGIPRLRTKWSQQRGSLVGVIEQSEVPDYFAVPVTMDIHTSAGIVRRQIRTDGPSTEFSFAISGQVESIQLDPDNILLAWIDRPE